MIIPSSKALMVHSCLIMSTVRFPHESAFTFQLALALLSPFILRKVYPNWRHGVILSQSSKNEWILLVNVWILTLARLQTPRLSVKSCSLPRALSVSELLRHRPELTCQKIRLQRQLFYIRKPKLTHWLSLNRADLAVQTQIFVTTLPQDHTVNY